VVFSTGEERRFVMSTKMGIWRGALAGAVVLLAVGTASARVIDPTGVTTNETAAIVLYPKLKVDLNTCVAGTCSLTPDLSCTTDEDCQTPPTAGVDTLIQLTNTSEFLTKVTASTRTRTATAATRRRRSARTRTSAPCVRPAASACRAGRRPTSA